MTVPTRGNPPDPRAGSSYGPTPAAPGGGRNHAPAAHGEVSGWPSTDRHGDHPQTSSQPVAGTGEALARLPEMLKVKEAAGILRVGRNQLYEAVARGEIPAVRIGRTLDPETVAVLRAHHTTQAAELLALGPAWSAGDLVFTREDGQPLHPDWFRRRFERRIHCAGLPKIRFQDPVP